MSDEVLCTHDLLLFGSDEDLVAASRSFVTDGIAAGDLVMVHGPGRGAAVLRGAFDDDPRIRFSRSHNRWYSASATAIDV